MIESWDLSHRLRQRPRKVLLVFFFCMTLFPAALLFHTGVEPCCIMITAVQFEAVYSQQTLRTSGSTSSALIQGAFPLSLLWLRHLYPRRRCPSCNRHFYPRGKCPLKSHWALLWDTRIWFQADVALLRRQCKVFNLVSDGKSRNEGSLLVSLTVKEQE